MATAFSVMVAAVVFDVPERIVAIADVASEYETQNCSGDHKDWIGINDLSNLENGNRYYLMSDVTIDKQVELDGVEITLCLNVHTIEKTGEERIFYIDSNSTFTLCNCTGDGKLTGTTPTTNYGGAVCVKNANFIMDGGTITGCTTRYSGGCVYVDSNGTFTMNGGAISNNSVTNSNGGGVYVNKGGTFVMKGGIISENNASSSGGGIYVNDGIFKMEDGEITDNQAKDGGGVYLTVA